VIAIVVAPGALYLLSVAAMVLGLAPVMLGFYELGGRVPRPLARGALAIGTAAIGLFVALTVAAAMALVTFDEVGPAAGAFAMLAICMLVFGVWLAGAALFAGGWLTEAPRLLGVLCGLGWAVAAIGILLGGAEHPLVQVGGVAYQLVFPIWGVLIGRRFAALRSATPEPMVAPVKP
jgi:hypothetical protein